MTSLPTIRPYEGEGKQGIPSALHGQGLFGEQKGTDMRRIFLVLGIVALGIGGSWLTANSALGQCQGGGRGGGATGGGTTTTTTTGTMAVASSPTLLTSQGSLAYQMMRAAAIQQQMAQMQLVRAQQVAAEREANLAKRQKNAERTRLATLERRERTRQTLAAQSGSSRSSYPAGRDAPSVMQFVRR